MSELQERSTTTNELGDLTLAIKKMHGGVIHASNAFDGNTKLAVNELKTMKTLIADTLKKLEAPLAGTKKNIDALDEVTNAMAIIPDKIHDEISSFPGLFSQLTKDSMSDLTKVISTNVGDRLIDNTNKLNIEVMSFIQAYNREMNIIIQKLQGDHNQITHDLKNDLTKYTEGLERAIDRSDRFRIKNLFYTTLFCGGASAIISSFIVLYMVG